MGDRIGRMRALSYSVLTYSVFTGLCYFVTAPWQLGALRFIAALGMGGEWALGVALVMESWPENRRPHLAGAIGAAANLGFAVIAVVGSAKPITRESWRWIMLAGAAPAFLTFLIRLYVPESHRWQNAKRVSSIQIIREVFGQGLLKSTLLGIAYASIALIGTWASIQWLPSWADQLTHGAIPRAKANAQILSALGAVVGAGFSPIIMRNLGRRISYFILCVASLGICALLFRTVTEYGPKFLTLCCIAGCSTASFYGWLALYLPELFPTRVRATGQGVCYNTGRILAAVAAVETGSLLQHYQGSYAQAGATMTLVYLAGMVLIWLAPETQGKPLPE
jgi:MFS family permease